MRAQSLARTKRRSNSRSVEFEVGAVLDMSPFLRFGLS